MSRYRSTLKSRNGDQRMEKRTYTVPEAAEALGIGRNAAYEAARTGQLPTIRIGKRILVPVAALERMLSVEQRKEPEKALTP